MNISIRLAWKKKKKFISYFLGILMPFKADKSKASRLSSVICHDADTHGISWTTESFSDFFGSFFFTANQNNAYAQIKRCMKYGHQLTVFTKEFPQLFFIHVITKIFNVDICKFFGSGTQFSLTLFARFEATHKSVFKLTMAKYIFTKHKLKMKQYKNFRSLLQWPKLAWLLVLSQYS